MKKLTIFLSLCFSVSIILAQVCTPNPASQSFGSGNTAFTVYFPGTTGNSCANCYTYLKANNFGTGVFTINGQAQSPTNYLCRSLAPCSSHYVQYTYNGQSSYGLVYVGRPTVQSINMQITNSSCSGGSCPYGCSCNCTNVPVMFSAQTCPAISNWSWSIKVTQTSGMSSTTTTYNSSAQNPTLTIPTWNGGTKIEACLNLCDGSQCCKIVRGDCLLDDPEEVLLTKGSNEFISVQPVREQITTNLIYPNPASTQIYLDPKLMDQSSEQMNIQIINTLGIKTYEAQLESNTLNISNLPNGIYFIIVRSNRKIIHTEKISVRR
ncbi:MAG: T9SS type A sorting domain-containing protein [Saprospiraceae bacterium]